MRKYAKALLLVFVALLYAGSAAAVNVSVAGPMSANESDVINVDVVLDSQGEPIYGYLMNVYFDPAVLSSQGGTYHPLPLEAYGSLYAYPDNWYITATHWTGAAPLVQSVATLVFHVMNVTGSTYTDIVPVVTTMLGTGGLDVGASVTPLSIHVPEPTTTMLMGLGLLGILYAGRRR